MSFVVHAQPSLLRNWMPAWISMLLCMCMQKTCPREYIAMYHMHIAIYSWQLLSVVTGRPCTWLDASILLLWVVTVNHHRVTTAGSMSVVATVTFFYCVCVWWWCARKRISKNIMENEFKMNEIATIINVFWNIRNCPLKLRSSKVEAAMLDFICFNCQRNLHLFTDEKQAMQQLSTLCQTVSSSIFLRRKGQSARTCQHLL